MNIRIVWRTLGKVLLIEAALMLLPLVTALICHESPIPFAVPLAGTALLGLGLSRVETKRTVYTARDAAHALRHRHTAAADRAAHEIETLLADTDLFEHYRMALLET